MNQITVICTWFHLKCMTHSHTQMCEKVPSIFDIKEQFSASLDITELKKTQPHALTYFSNKSN